MGLLRKLAGGQGKTEDNQIGSIIDNLNHVLNTSRGYGYFLDDFGLSDYKYLGTREDIERAIIAEVSENIQRFEPRVILKRIESIQDGKLFRLAFRIDCMLLNSPRALTLFLDPAQPGCRVSL